MAAHAGRGVRSERKYRRRRAGAALVLAALAGGVVALVLSLGSGGPGTPAARAGTQKTPPAHTPPLAHVVHDGPHGTE